MFETSKQAQTSQICKKDVMKNIRNILYAK